MRHFILTLLLFSIVLQGFSQPGWDARILERDETFVMNSKTDGTRKVHIRVRVENENGDDAAMFLLYTDSFRSLADFKGELESGSGQKTKIGKKDLRTFSISEGTADDSYATVFSPESSYPYTVTYDYSVSYRNGILSFPVFSPVNTDATKLDKASYTLQLPKGTQILSHAEGLEASQDKSGKKDIYRWEVKDLAPVVDEHLMPPIDLPLLYSLPVDFVYGGVPGTQADWKEDGAWLHTLQDGTGNLDELDVQKARDLVAGCADDFQKVRALYAYLREKTRYVSIQLGIGGLKPMPAATVAKTGFGDCKALANYLQSLLKAVGVESYYFAVSTDTPELLHDIPAHGQMDHAMLAVPLPEKNDTLFVECTNPRMPLGYRHNAVAGHEILLVTPEGGRLVKVGAYPDSLRRSIWKTDVKLNKDGSAGISIDEAHFLEDSERYIGFTERDPQAQKRRLTSGWDLQVDDLKILSVTDNFQDYEQYGRAYCPEVRLNFTMNAGKYANRSGNRLFVPVNPVAGKLDFQRTERVNGIFRDNPFIITDELFLHIPDGYKIEKIPADADLDTEWGRFISTFSVEADGIRIVQQFSAKAFNESKDKYGEYRDFARKVNKIYGSSIVLVSE